MPQEKGKPARTTRQAITKQQIQQIQQIAETIQFGSITLVFQDGILIQIDKSEKIRISK